MGVGHDAELGVMARPVDDRLLDPADPPAAEDGASDGGELPDELVGDPQVHEAAVVAAVDDAERRDTGQSQLLVEGGIGHRRLDGVERGIEAVLDLEAHRGSL